METLQNLLNFILHIDIHLTSLIVTYGAWTYALLFLIIFCETGLIVIPFLPGDSLLFAAGSIAATNEYALNVHLLFILLLAASITGNMLNYSIGRLIGPRVFSSDRSRLFNKQHLVRAHHFYNKFGGKALILARFIPIIRTFAPFVAGAAQMTPSRFHFFNITGAIAWIGSLLYLSFWFGTLPIVKDNFSYVIIGIVLFSTIPPIISLLRQSFSNK